MARNRVRNNTQATSKVKNPNQPISNSEKLIFDFSYKNWLQGIKSQGFTNLLKDDSQFAEYIIHIFQILLSVVQDNWRAIKTRSGGFVHCHTVAQDKLEQVKKITECIHGNRLDDEISNEYNFWQLGIQHGIRMVAIYNHDTNVMYPIFLDYHHQIHPSIKYNEDDIDAYEFCPISTYS